VGVGKGTVHNLISDYNRFGPGVVETTGRGGRRNTHLAREEEDEFIAPFVDMAQKGQPFRVRGNHPSPRDRLEEPNMAGPPNNSGQYRLRGVVRKELTLRQEIREARTMQFALLTASYAVFQSHLNDMPNIG
jgi:hypothetical protein